MPKLLNLEGRRFGRWIVLSFAGVNALGKSTWRCLCLCGRKRRIVGSDLISGMSRSCGCYKTDVTRARSLIHGMSHTREYGAWKTMKTRCYNRRCEKWKTYGGRGIRVCTRWRRSFSAFYSDMGPRPPGRTIDRRNNDGDYRPENCRWATAKTQANNQRKRRVRCKPKRIHPRK